MKEALDRLDQNLKDMRKGVQEDDSSTEPTADQKTDRKNAGLELIRNAAEAAALSKVPEAEATEAFSSAFRRVSSTTSTPPGSPSGKR